MLPSDFDLATMPMPGGTAGAAPAYDLRQFLGPYRLLRQLGHGGMGVVWLAERSDGHLKRLVALKLPLQILGKLPEFRARFAQERDILSALVHSNIARLYDADVVQDRPYLVLEFVEGQPLTAYCNDRNLPLPERLRLFLQILSAVQYAHSHLVVHRDLKPSNIFVTANGEVKLLDFGTAKLLGHTGPNAGDLTQAGASALTPNYASPEQLAGRPVSTATDIYSLGIVLYELLSGSRPVRPIAEVLTAPSSAVTDSAAAACATTRDKLRRSLRGDLDSIVAKALRPEPGERFGSAAEFASDIERYLNGRSVMARGDAASYRLRKFLFRHKLAAASTSIAMVAIVAAVVVATLGWRQARSQAQRSAATEDFLKQIFTANSTDGADPVRARQTTARELLDIGRDRIKTSLRDAPAARLDVLGTLRGLYRDLGLDDQATALGQEEVALARQLWGNQDVRTAEALIHLAQALHASNSVNRRESVLREAEAILDGIGDRGSLVRGTLHQAWSEHYQSTDYSKALLHADRAVAILRRLPLSEDLAEALYEKSLAHSFARDDARAETAITEAISISRRLKGDGNTELPRFYAYQGEARQNLMRFAEAEESFRSALAVARRLKGGDDVDTIETELRLGHFLFYTSRPAEGLAHLRTALDRSLRVKGPADPFYTPKTQYEYGWALANFGRPQEGLVYLTGAIDNRRANRPGTAYLAQMLVCRAAAEIELNYLSAAARSLSEASAIRNALKAPVSWFSLRAEARLYEAQGQPEKSAAILNGIPLVDSSSSPTVESLHRQEARLHGAFNAARYSQVALDGERLLHTLESGSASHYLQNAQANVAFETGRALLQLHQPGRAEPYLRKAVTLESQLLDARSPHLREARLLLAQASR